MNEEESKKEQKLKSHIKASTLPWHYLCLLSSDFCISCKSDLGFTLLFHLHLQRRVSTETCATFLGTHQAERKGNHQKHPHFCMLEVCARGDSLNTTVRSRPYSQASSWKYTSWDVIIIFNEHSDWSLWPCRRNETEHVGSECCDLLFHRNPAVSLTGIRVVAVRWQLEMFVCGYSSASHSPALGSC